jgi:hypothetical protein
MLLVIDKQKMQVTQMLSAAEAAGFMLTRSITPGDVSWQIKRTGRYDDNRYVVIPLAPDEE